MFHLRHAIACKFRKGNHLRQECNNKQYIANYNHAIYNNKKQEHRVSHVCYTVVKQKKAKKAKSKFTNISELHYAICCQTQMVPVNSLTKRLQLNGHTKNHRILFTNSKVRDKQHFTLRVKKRLKTLLKSNF